MMSQRTILLLTLLIVGLLTAAFWDYTQDDVFITYAYSRNLTEGQGFVFNPGERVQGTTTPLYTLLMAGVHLLTDEMLHVGNLLSALFLILTVALALDLTRPFLSVWGRGALALMLVTSPLVYVSFGMETLFYCALLMFSLWLWSRGGRIDAMLAAAALTWTRADGVVLGAALCAVALMENQRARPDASPLTWIPWRLGLTYSAAIAPWYLFAWGYFGTPFPNTFGAKQQSFEGLRFWTDGWGWWESFYGNNLLSLLAAPLILWGMWRAFKSAAIRPLAVWVFGYALGYTVLNTTAFWYYTPWFAGLVILAAFGGESAVREAARLLPRLHLPSRIGFIGAVGVVIISAVMAAGRAADFATPPGRVNTYVIVGEWIEANTPQDSILLIGDLGIMGYHARRHTLDSQGLIVPEMYIRTDAYAVAKYKPDYVVGTGYYTWVELTAQDWFNAYYLPVAGFSTPRDEFSPMTVYRRRYPLTPPEVLPVGFPLPLSCRVQVAEGVRIPPSVDARLTDSEGRVVAGLNTPFLAGQYPQPNAAGDEILQEQVILPLDVPPGDYTWQLNCDGAQTTGDIQIIPLAETESYVSLEGFGWSERGQLSGLAFPSEGVVWSGGALEVALDWGNLTLANPDEQVFLHLVDGSGAVVAQADYPATSPADMRTLRLPPDLPAGTYGLVIGWYNWRSQERIRLESGEDSLRLPVTIEVRFPGGSGLP